MGVRDREAFERELRSVLMAVEMELVAGPFLFTVAQAAMPVLMREEYERTAG